MIGSPFCTSCLKKKYNPSLPTPWALLSKRAETGSPRVAASLRKIDIFGVHASKSEYMSATPPTPGLTGPGSSP